MQLLEITRVIINPSDPADLEWFGRLEKAVKDKSHWTTVGKGVSTLMRVYEDTKVVFNADEVLNEMLRED